MTRAVRAAATTENNRQANRRHGAAAHAARRVRHQAPASRPGGSDSRRDRGARRARDHADRRRQVAVLPVARAASRRRHARRLAADRADEGPGRHAGRGGHAGRAGQQRIQRRRVQARRSPTWSPARSKIVFVTPERLTDADTLRALERAPIARWSSTRRTASASGATTFARRSSTFANALAALGNPPVLALTATATDAVADDIRAAARRGRR